MSLRPPRGCAYEAIPASRYELQQARRNCESWLVGRCDWNCLCCVREGYAVGERILRISRLVDEDEYAKCSFPA
ncbi:hypothetical protein GCM10012275_32920 [Longimycelium tulufanense]|uniref:Uncharacterized protein n=1 Tax=Longimycelium tulufanense TaxID=907463 RepID=A0A8J3CF36_9PSEU|nr:hypothetical protein GCM10012275_32920 [Longimycelium tulufanense]